jgi:hypothetical protein
MAKFSTQVLIFSWPDKGAPSALILTQKGNMTIANQLFLYFSDLPSLPY